MSCSGCVYERIEGSRYTSGGIDAVGYDQAGCLHPVLSNAYTLCEPAAMLLEGLMIQQASEGNGCRWKQHRAVAGNTFAV